MTTHFITRFAPSPTGHLHSGHAYSALLAYRRAREEGGRFLLRIEDIDQTRCRPEFKQQIFEDLAWLGLVWEEPVVLQSKRFSEYATALEMLKQLGVVYPCFCTRKDIQHAVARAGEPMLGPDGPIYPGTCRGLSDSDARKNMNAGRPHTWRLDVKKALTCVQERLVWVDEVQGEISATPEIFGDVVLSRKDTPTSYHLSVVVDDAAQGISHVIRGKDLFEATHVHRLLQALLGLTTPLYFHHELLTDRTGERLAKRRGSESIKSLQEAGVSRDELIAAIGLEP